MSDDYRGREASADAAAQIVDREFNASCRRLGIDPTNTEEALGQMAEIEEPRPYRGRSGFLAPIRPWRS